MFFILLRIISVKRRGCYNKKDEPDGYYGLKLGAIVTPTFSYRIRDKASGTTDLSPSDRSGFSLPWTLFFVSKQWEETGVKVEFWGEILRGDAISQNTATDGGNKSNPYIFAIRRANVSKTWSFSSTKHTLQFGMFELPHMFSVWSGYYDWRYIDRSPLESLGLQRPSRPWIKLHRNLEIPFASTSNCKWRRV